MAKGATLLVPAGKSQKPRRITPTRPSAAIEAAYRARLECLVDEMQRSLMRFLSAQYRATPPEMASDATPAEMLRRAFGRLAKRWTERFDEAAPNLAAAFIRQASGQADQAFRHALRKAGMTVQFRMTPAVADIAQASVIENVSLIKSIGAQHLASVEQIVMRSVTTGRDLGQLSQDLQHQHGVTRRRAGHIALHQNNVATAAITRARQQEAGITQARWLHSSGGRHPRPEHVQAGKDRLVYEVAKGAFLEGKWTWPGVEIGCRCVSIPIIPGLTK